MVGYGFRKVFHTAFVAFGEPFVELFQEVVIYGVSKRVTLQPRADYRIIVFNAARDDFLAGASGARAGIIRSRRRIARPAER